MRGRRARRSALGAALAAFGAGCGGAPTGPASDGTVAAQATRDAVRVTNRGAAPVFVLVVGREGAAYSQYALCADTARCPTLAPGASRDEPRPGAVPFRDRPEREALVWWWRGVRDGRGGWRPDSVRALGVPLP